MKKIKKWVEENVVLVGVILTIFLINLSLFLPKDRFQQAKERLVRNPSDLQAHLILAEEHLKNNQIDEAERELLWAEKHLRGGVAPAAYLGGESVFDRLWQQKRYSDPEDIKELIKYWEGIVSEKPDYRDGFIQLALLHYKLYQNEKAKEYLQKALELDPNFKPAREMEKILIRLLHNSLSF